MNKNNTRMTKVTTGTTITGGLIGTGILPGIGSAIGGGIGWLFGRKLKK